MDGWVISFTLAPRRSWKLGFRYKSDNYIQSWEKIQLIIAAATHLPSA